MTKKPGGDMIHQYWRNVNTVSARVWVTGLSSRAPILPLCLLSVQENSVEYVIVIKC